MVERTTYYRDLFWTSKKIEMDPSLAFDLPFKSKQKSDDYIESVLKDNLTFEELDRINNYGMPFGTWERYRNLYKWLLVYKGDKNPTEPVMTSQYLNGESYDIPAHFNDDLANTLNPFFVPCRCRRTTQASDS